MVRAGEVLAMLCPNAKYSLIGDKYEDINWFNESPAITKEQYLQGFKDYAYWKQTQIDELNKAKENAQIKLAALGITADDLKALGLG